MTSATITKIIEQGERFVSGQRLPFQTLELVKPDKTSVIIELEATPQTSIQLYRVGDKVWLDSAATTTSNPKSTWIITDYNRQEPLLVLALLFAVLVIGIGKWRGFWSLIALGLSFLIITFFTVPLITTGWNPILISILTAVLILPVNFYLSHGWQLKTHLALGSTILALIITSFLAQVFIQTAHLTGMASEEAGFLLVENPDLINFQNLILAAVIVGALGILDDVTVSQTSVVFELKAANPNFNWRELYRRGMKIGQDHISSMVNTLVLVYAGAALPLLLLFSRSSKSFGELINSEIIAEEIIKTLTGSIGLIFAAPLTTLLAALVLNHPKFKKFSFSQSKESHSHPH